MIRALLWPLRVLWGTSRIILFILFVTALSLNVATLTMASVFSLASGFVETFTGGKSIRGGHKKELETQRARTASAGQSARAERTRAEFATRRLQAERVRTESAMRNLQTERARTASAMRNLQTERATSARLSRDLDDEKVRSRIERDRFRREVESNRVPYRGQRKDAREAVKDATHRISSRLTQATVTNVGSAFGEALPFIGIAVIAAATGYEVYQACEMMDDIHELASAFDSEDSLDNSVCGIRTPTSAEIVERIKASPGAAWQQAKNYYAELPDVDVLDWSYQWVLEAYDWMLAIAGGGDSMSDGGG